jgi:hypothetical protein
LLYKGSIAGIMLALFWNVTVYIFNAQRSVAFFTSVFALAILDCTCTIVFLTYIGKFRGNYITGLYIGEGISSLLPSIFALFQGIGDDNECPNNNTLNYTFSNDQLVNLTIPIINVQLKEPRFSVSVYFWLLFSILMVSFIAFLILDIWPGFNEYRVESKSQKSIKNRLQLEDAYINNDDSFVELENIYPINNDQIDPIKNVIIRERVLELVEKTNKTDQYILLLAITIVSFVLYGFIPGLSSYSGSN